MSGPEPTMYQGLVSIAPYRMTATTELMPKKRYNTPAAIAVFRGETMRVAACVVIYMCLSPFLPLRMNKRNHSNIYSARWTKSETDFLIQRIGWD